jgi:hypothetical protein
MCHRRDAYPEDLGEHAHDAKVDAAAMDVAVEVSLADGTRVRVGNSAHASLLCDVFAALDRR